MELLEPSDDKREAKVQHNSGLQEWYTPDGFVEAARDVLGEIELDPASSEAAQRTVNATVYYTKQDDGLAHDWDRLYESAVRRGCR